MRVDNHYTRDGWVSRGGYHAIRIDNKDKLKHRLIAEELIGRPLRADEAVHHINGNKRDNRPENLMVLTKRVHHIYHASKNYDDRKLIVERIESGMTYREAIKGTSVKSIATVCRWMGRTDT